MGAEISQSSARISKNEVVFFAMDLLNSDRLAMAPHGPLTDLWLSSMDAMRPRSMPSFVGTHTGVPTWGQEGGHHKCGIETNRSLHPSPSPTTRTFAMPSTTSTPTTIGSFLLNTHAGMILSTQGNTALRRAASCSAARISFM